MGEQRRTWEQLRRGAVVAFVAGFGLVGSAWAGTVLAPAPAAVGGFAGLRDLLPGQGGGPAEVIDQDETQVEASRQGEGRSGYRRRDDDHRGGPPGLPGLPAGVALTDGTFLVGADASSLAPDPDRWQTEGCSVYLSEFPEELTHLAGRITEQMVLPGWPKSPDCIYLGGYGLGPARPAEGIDPTTGYDVQTVVIANDDQLVIWQQTPLVGFFSSYRDDLCERCGILDIRRELAERYDTELSNVVIASNHSHAGADGYGAWGGMPTWYREQIADTLLDSAERAVAAARPATIEIGQTSARSFSRERRSTYHSVADQGAVWLQARELAPGGRDGDVIATVANFAAHPTVLGSSNLLLHGDWPHTAGHALGELHGGVGVVFEGGLGNVVPSRPRNAPEDLTGDGEVGSLDNVLQMGRDFAALIAEDVDRGGHRLTSSEIASVEREITHPVTNWTLGAVALTSLLDREFFAGDGGQPGGVHYSARPDTGMTRPCVSASPTAVTTQLTALRLGELTLVTAPGEIFSGISLVAKAKLRQLAYQGGETMVLGQAQDSLGYIIQSYEVHPPHGLGTGAGLIEYEETFMLDDCFGDHVLETMLDLGDAVWE